MKHISRAIQLNPELPAVAEAVCRSGVDQVIAHQVANSTKDPTGMATALVLCGLRWQRNDIVQLMAQYAQVARLGPPHPDLYGESPLCYAAATRNVRAFGALVKIQVNPTQKCRDGYTVAERIQQMVHRGVKEAERMQTLMNRFYKKN